MALFLANVNDLLYSFLQFLAATAIFMFEISMSLTMNFPKILTTEAGKYNIDSNSISLIGNA